MEGGEIPRAARFWLALVLPPLALLVSQLAAALALAVVLLAQGGREIGERGEIAAWLKEHGDRLPVLLALFLPIQIVLVAATLAAARLEGRDLRRRLGLVAPRGGALALAAAVLGTPAFYWIGALLLQRIGVEPSEHLIEMEETLRRPSGWRFAVLGAIATLGAGFGEELLFRGYVQPRFAERLGAARAIVLAALLFALIHVDPVHGLYVLLPGLWFGWIAWRTRSVVPAILCHAGGNAAALLMIVAFAGGEPAGGVSFALLVGSALCAALAATRLAR